ncbi:MAG: beta-N-acetylglucosaminidase domain-containing protein [Kiritimatiellae bacterium]|nr:beta-N-acetylglucosaminidase domain-containing protein [Kiritimatiellia bacterium]
MAVNKTLLSVICMLAIAPGLSAGDAAKVRDRLATDPYMIPFYTGAILPKPQIVAYSQEFYSLDNAGILAGRDVVPDDPRLKILLNRITQYGGNYKIVASLDNDCDTIFAVGDTGVSDGLKVPENAQGYAIRCFKKDGKNIVAFKGRDHLGALWAINSLVQMITLREDKTVLQAVDVSDYPFMLGRGTIGPGVSDYVVGSRICPVMTKLDRIYFSKSLLVPRRGQPREWIDWRTPRPKELIDKVVAIGENLRGLGIKWQVGIMPFAIGDTINEQVQVDSKGDEHFDIIWKMCEPVMKAGGGLTYGPDDYRFPLSTEDMINFGTAREADIYIINRLYAKMKATNPDATMSIVQPFYHGPRSQNPWSDESPIDYLKAIGERLPEDIGITWTGPMVKTSYFTREDVDKMTALIKRKPFFFQNASDVFPMHMYRYIYPTDVIKWWLNTGRDVNVYKELAGASLNSLGLYSDMLWSAMLWNPEAFNPEEAARQATCMLVGLDNYETLRRLVEALSYADKYYITRTIGKVVDAGVFPSFESARDIAAIDKHILEAETLMDEYENKCACPAAVKQWASLSWQLDIIRKFRAGIIEDKRFDIYRAAVDQEKRARREVELRETDVFLAACDFKGGDLGYASTLLAEDKRPAMTLSGHKPAAAAEFEISGNAGGQGLELILSGKMCGDPAANLLSDAGESEAREIGIYLNEKKVFEGKAPFASDEWKFHSFPAQGVNLRLAEKNVLVVKVPKGNDTLSVEPVFSINYAVIKNTREERRPAVSPVVAAP